VPYPSPLDAPPVDRTPDECAALARLAEKYRTLAAWRRRKAEGGGEPERAAFRTVATEFPGALRELEVLSLPVLDARASALAAAARGAGPTEPWMRAIEAYHRWMRAALWVKRRGARGDEDPEALARACAARHAVAADGAFVQDALHPREGRMRPIVLARAAREQGLSSEEIAAIVLERDAARGD
jgi:hypothetical protein